MPSNAHVGSSSSSQISSRIWQQAAIIRRESRVVPTVSNSTREFVGNLHVHATHARSAFTRLAQTHVAFS